MDGDPTDRSVERLRETVANQTGLDLDSDADYRLASAAETLAERYDFVSPEAFAEAYLRRRPDEWTEAFVALLVSDETCFFRDQHPFEGLRRDVLPELFRPKPSHRPLRVWSAACSSGQEVYSLAILLDEHFPGRWPEQTHLLGSDISEEAIRRARRGRYTQIQVNRGLPAKYLPTYFEQQGRHWVVDGRIADHVEFRRINLLDSLPPLPTMDLVVLRYLLTYYTDRRRRELLDRLHGALRQDGILILGGAETWSGIHRDFRLERTERTRFYRKV